MDRFCNAWRFWLIHLPRAFFCLLAASALVLLQSSVDGAPRICLAMLGIAMHGIGLWRGSVSQCIQSAHGADWFRDAPCFHLAMAHSCPKRIFCLLAALGSARLQSSVNGAPGICLAMLGIAMHGIGSWRGSASQYMKLANGEDWFCDACNRLMARIGFAMHRASRGFAWPCLELQCMELTHCFDSNAGANIRTNDASYVPPPTNLPKL